MEEITKKQFNRYEGVRKLECITKQGVKVYSVWSK